MGTKRIYILALSFLCTGAWAQDGTARGVGSGLLYPVPNMGVFLNPAALPESPKMSLQGLYRTEPELASGSLTGGGKQWGWGLGYRQAPADTNIYEGGLGIKWYTIMVGGSYRRITNAAGQSRNDGDLSLVFDLGGIRLGGIARSVDNGANRYDLGLGLMPGENTYFEVNVKIPDPNPGDRVLVDVGVAIHNHHWTIGVGYDFELVDSEEIENGQVHAGLSLGILESTFLDAHYRLHTQEWSADEFTFGLRMFF